MPTDPQPPQFRTFWQVFFAVLMAGLLVTFIYANVIVPAALDGTTSL